MKPSRTLNITPVTEGRGLSRISLPTTVVVYSVLALGVAALWPIVTSLAGFWFHVQDYHHGFLIAAICVGWLASLHQAIAAEPAKPELRAAWALVTCVALWLIAFKGSSELSQQILLPPLLWLAVLTATGYRVARVIAPPLAYLYFSVPIWEYLIPVLQRMTVWVTETALNGFGVPVVIEDTEVWIPEGTFRIAEGCSGKRYFVVALALAVLGGVVARLPARKRAILIVSAALLAVVANWVRVMIVVWAGHITQMKSHLVAVEHLTLGWQIFAVLMVVLALFIRFLASSEPDTAPPARDSRQPAPEGLTLGLAGALAPLAVATGFTLFTPAEPAPEAKLGVAPEHVGSWVGPLPADSRWRPRFIGPDDQRRVAYRLGEERVEVYLNVYGRQTAVKKPVYYENSMVTPRQWRPVGRAALNEILAASAGRAPMEILVTTDAGDSWVVGYMYKVGGQTTGNPLLAQLLYGARALTGDVPGGVLALAVRCHESCDGARRLLAEFWTEHGAAMLGMIPARLPERQ